MSQRTILSTPARSQVAGPGGRGHRLQARALALRRLSGTWKLCGRFAGAVQAETGTVRDKFSYVFNLLTDLLDKAQPSLDDPRHFETLPRKPPRGAMLPKWRAQVRTLCLSLARWQ